MAETKVKIILDDGVEMPKYATPGSAGFDIKVNKVLKLFKGNKEIDLSTELKNSIDSVYKNSI